MAITDEDHHRCLDSGSRGEKDRQESVVAAAPVMLLASMLLLNLLRVVIIGLAIVMTLMQYQW